MISTSPLVKTYTLQEFWDLPEPTDHSKLELIKGVLYMTPPPDVPHSEVSSQIHEVLLAAIRKNGYRGKLYAPRTALWIDDDTYLEPDLMYLSDKLKAQMKPDHWTRADIVIEILSPSTAVYDRTTKSDTYQIMGIREMWNVDVATREVEVRSFEAGASILYRGSNEVRSQVLPKISLPLESFFSL